MPTAQSWAENPWGEGTVLLALVLCIVFVGIFFVAYLLLRRPDGSLAVTYSLTDTDRTTDPGSASLAERLRELEDAHGAGLVTDEERATRRAEILAEL